MSKNKYPTIVLVGRTNVGKSTLFNKLSSDEKSIVFDAAGVTRDVIKEVISWNGATFELIDTGGVSFARTQDILQRETWARAFDAIENADMILFVTDSEVGLLPEDRQIASYLYKLGKHIILIANKSDTTGAQDRMFEFDRLGFKKVIPLSAIHSKGIIDVLDEIVAFCPTVMTEQEETDDSASKVVLLGKPNVGKSSLMNALLKYDRAIVSDIPGTTREPIREKVRFYQEDIILTDTAGVRKKRSVEEPLEQLMAKSTLRAVKDADVVLLMVDSSEGELSDQELKLAFYAFEAQYKSLIILFNKHDLVKGQEYTLDQLATSVERYQFLIKKVETLSISCITGHHLGKVLPLLQKVVNRSKQQFSIEDLTMLFKTELQQRPLYKNEQTLVVHRAQQIKSTPIIIALYVNNPPFFQDAQCKYFENVMRKHYDLKGAAIKIVIRKR